MKYFLYSHLLARIHIFGVNRILRLFYGVSILFIAVESYLVQRENNVKAKDLFRAFFDVLVTAWPTMMYLAVEE